MLLSAPVSSLSVIMFFAASTDTTWPVRFFAGGSCAFAAGGSCAFAGGSCARARAPAKRAATNKPANAIPYFFIQLPPDFLYRLAARKACGATLNSFPLQQQCVGTGHTNLLFDFSHDLPSSVILSIRQASYPSRLERQVL